MRRTPWRCLGAKPQWPATLSVDRLRECPLSKFTRSQQKYVKKSYRVRNWHNYEEGLRNRASLTVWIRLVDGKLADWDAKKSTRPKGGRPRKYSNHAIETAITLGMVFHLASRQTEGFLESLFVLLGLTNDVPDHTTISSTTVLNLTKRVV